MRSGRSRVAAYASSPPASHRSRRARAAASPGRASMPSPRSGLAEPELHERRDAPGSRPCVGRPSVAGARAARPRLPGASERRVDAERSALARCDVLGLLDEDAAFGVEGDPVARQAPRRPHGRARGRTARGRGRRTRPSHPTSAAMSGTTSRGIADPDDEPRAQRRRGARPAPGRVSSRNHVRFGLRSGRRSAGSTTKSGATTVDLARRPRQRGMVVDPQVAPEPDDRGGHRPPVHSHGRVRRTHHHAMHRIRLPDPSLVVLIGASGSGKSTFAARHFAPDEVLSSDAIGERSLATPRTSGRRAGLPPAPRGAGPPTGAAAAHRRRRDERDAPRPARPAGRARTRPSGDRHRARPAREWSMPGTRDATPRRPRPRSSRVTSTGCAMALVSGRHQTEGFARDPPHRRCSIAVDAVRVVRRGA